MNDRRSSRSSGRASRSRKSPPEGDLAKPKLITPEEAKAYKDRWRLVHEAERTELRQQSPEDKLRQLTALMAMGRDLGWLQRLESKGESDCQNWLRLRRAFRD